MPHRRARRRAFATAAAIAAVLLAAVVMIILAAPAFSQRIGIGFGAAVVSGTVTRSAPGLWPLGPTCG